jgi:tryptophan-rich sensory protein
MLIRPSWTPPAWVFSPAWTVQYGLMGGAAWLVWNGTTGTGNDKLLGLWLFGIQLILNGAWPWIFFGNRLIFAGAVDAAALWVVFGLTLWWFRKVNRFSVLLLMPCFLWITYTAAVNFALWGRNR